MKKYCLTVFATATLTFIGSGCSQSEPLLDIPPITHETLLSDLTNVQRFAESPRGQVSMVSSHDLSGGNEDWATWTGLDKDGLFEVANLKGPGCIKRIWMTSTGAGEWHFFIDGEKKPSIKVANMDLFGESEQFPQPICNKVSGGYYSFMPPSYPKTGGVHPIHC